MVAVVLLLVAGVAHASAHKFLEPGQDAGERLVADAAEEKLELGKFFDEVSSESSKLQKALNEEKAKNAELAKKEHEAVSELHHAKSVFATELHKVESRVAGKVKGLEKENEKLKEEVSRDKLTLVLHEKTEDALRQSLGQISKVFQSQQAAVQNIISTTSDVDSKLKAQDAKTPAAEAPAPEPAVEPKVDAPPAPEPAADDTAADQAVVEDAKVEDVEEKLKVDDPAPPADDSDAQEKPDSQATTVALTHHTSAKAKPAKAEASTDLDLDDTPKPAAAEAPVPTAAPKKESEMDSIKAEVDALDKEVDSPDDAAPAVAAVATKADSSSMLSNAGDALNKLLKS